MSAQCRLFKFTVLLLEKVVWEFLVLFDTADFFSELQSLD